jgi:hypothetical protein
MLTKSTLLRFLKMHLLSIRVTMVISAPSLLTWCFQRPHTQKRARHGSTPKDELSWGERQFLPQDHRERTGRSSGTFASHPLMLACLINALFVDSAISEVVGSPLPYDDVMFLRDRMWEISPTLVRYDVVEPTSNAISILGMKQLSTSLASAKVKGIPFTKPISNFYQTDVISRA